MARRFSGYSEALRFLRGRMHQPMGCYWMRKNAHELGVLGRSDRETAERLAWELLNDQNLDRTKKQNENGGSSAAGDKPKKDDEDKNKPKPKPAPKPKPKPTTKLRVIVLDKATKKPIEGVVVKVKGESDKKTDKKGHALWDPIKPGKYEASARKDMCGPDPVEQKAVEVTEAKTKEVTLLLEPFELHLHLDANRDGKVDDAWDKNAPWQAGAGKFGAIAIFNNDNDDNDGAKERDFENKDVDTAADLSDILPIELRRHPAAATLPATVTAKLTLSDPQKLRILEPRTAKGKELVGPSTAKGEFDNAALAASAKIELGMEGLQYPDSAFDGKVKLMLEVSQNGAVVHKEEAEVRIAPWMIFNHENETEKVYMLDAPDNRHIQKAINDTLSAIGLPSIHTASRITYSSDRWMQDGMEPGYASVPSTADPLATPVTLRTAFDRTGGGSLQIDGFPKKELLGKDYGFSEAVKPTRAGVSSLDSFGNLECSPPFKHKSGRDYRFGRMVFGGSTQPILGAPRSMHTKVIQHLKAQTVQDPVEIHSDWLVVGHVDEFISFLPNAGGSHGWKIMIAAPKLALDIALAEADKTPLFHGADLTLPHLFFAGGKIGDEFPLRTVGAIRADAAFKKIQTDAQAVIDKVRTTELMPAFDLVDSDFIHIPGLFTQARDKRFVAYTAGSVNMLVVTESPSAVHLCIPKPFGPYDGKICLYEKEIERVLSPHVASHKFIDDLQSYHTGQGEIHCGTNSQRTPPKGKWWELDWI